MGPALYINMCIYILVVARSGGNGAQCTCNIHPWLRQIGAKAACAMLPVQLFIRMFHPRLPPDDLALIRAVGYIESDLWHHPFHVPDTMAWLWVPREVRRG